MAPPPPAASAPAAAPLRRPPRRAARSPTSSVASLARYGGPQQAAPASSLAGCLIAPGGSKAGWKGVDLRYSRAAATLAAVAIAVAAWWYRAPLIDVLETRSAAAGAAEPALPVRVISWQPEEPFASRFAEHRMPLVLRNTIASTWPALQRWTPEYLAEHVGALQDVYVHRKKTFTFYDPTKPLAEVPGIIEDVRASHQMVNLTMHEFVDRARMDQSPDGLHYYYSGPLGDFPPDISVEVDPWEWLVPLRGASNTTSVWMGYNGSIAHTHYDIFHNFNVQLYGRKRFELFPPTEWTKLYHYPRHHPSYRQSQVDFEAPDLRRFPRFRHVKRYEVVLEPGDMLYLPPYWSHRVTALEASISVNVFSDTAELLAYYRTQMRSLETLMPFLKNGPQIANTLRELFTALAGALMPADAVQLYFVALYETRYEPLQAVLDPAAEYDFAVCNGAPRNQPQVKALLRPIVADLQELFERIPAGEREMALGNYIEDIARMMVTTTNVSPFIRRCLARRP